MTTQWKTPPIESGKILAACKGRPCFLGFSGCDGGGQTTVPCHSPFREDNQGVAQKAHDFLTVPGCRHCHDVLDDRVRQHSESDRRHYFHAALKKWLEVLFREGIITVRGMK